MDKTGVIYKITSPTGRIYVGQTTKLKDRVSAYKRHKCKKQTRLHRSFEKYGYESHLFEIIEKTLLEVLTDRERYWQDFYNVLDKKKGLNSVLVAGNNKPHILSEETRLKLRNANLGKKHSVESLIKISKSKKGQGLGRKRTSQERYNMSKGRIGIVFSDEHKINLSIAAKNKSYFNTSGLMTPESREKARLSKIKNGSNAGAKNSNARIVFNTETGIFYDFTGEASFVSGINRGTLTSWLNGNKKNKSSFVYA